ncbi:hypothetical protein KKG31_03395 [Patescibacteria group bacterium]|nr:hypothetical protein [Patescibacteria group bacterium]MBU1758192.1 hypothetical protein [Patescibacteria group bacterium]
MQTKNPEVVGISNEEIEKHIKYKSSILKFIPQVAGEPSSFAKEDKIVSLSQMDKSERQRDFF